MTDHYTPDEQAVLLRLARQALEEAAAGRPLTLPDLGALSPALRADRACFVTLHTRHGDLRGCTGVLEARAPLAREVCTITGQTALQDPRFMPVQPGEVRDLRIEISVLTPPEPLAFDAAAHIPALLRPGEDGVILMIGGRRATFLPQVWERAPDPVAFLDLLCHKMGLPAGSWRRQDVHVAIYHAVMIEEAAPQ